VFGAAFMACLCQSACRRCAHGVDCGVELVPTRGTLPTAQASAHYAGNGSRRANGRSSGLRRTAFSQLSWRVVAGLLTVGSAVLVSFGVGLATQGVLATTSSLVPALSVLTGAGFTHAVAFTVARRPVGSGTNLRSAVAASTATSLVLGIVVAVAGSNVL